MKAKELGLAAGGLGVLGLILHFILNKRNRPRGFEGVPRSAGPALLERAAQIRRIGYAASQGASRASSLFGPTNARRDGLFSAGRASRAPTTKPACKT